MKTWLLQGTALACLLCLWQGKGEPLANEVSIHTVFSVDCQNSNTLQTLALVYSHHKAGQPGPLTRILSCDEEELRGVDKETMGMVATYVSPSVADDAETGDHYSLYNRPKGIENWLRDSQPQEEWILIVEPNVVFNRPLVPSTSQISQGYADAAHAASLSGCSGPFAENFLGGVAPKNDQFGGPPGRKCDYVELFVLIKKSDLTKIAPRWYQFSRDIRMDTQNLSWTQEPEFDLQGRLLTADKYGYAMAASSLGIIHHAQVAVQSNIHETLDAQALDEPSLLRYSSVPGSIGNPSSNNVPGDSSLFSCPLENSEKKDIGLFGHPPHPSEVMATNQILKYHRLLRIKLVNTLNGALCQRLLSFCTHGDGLEEACKEVGRIDMEIESEEDKLTENDICSNVLGTCTTLQAEGKCSTEFLEMSLGCRNTCGLCHFQVNNYSSVASRPSIKGAFAARSLPPGGSQRARELTLWVVSWMGACTLVVISLLRILSRPLKARSLADWQMSKDSFYKKPMEARL